MNPEVSVVIPAYNAAATIGAQLGALARQRTNRTFEVIVVDNRSTDNTSAAVTAHEADLPALRLLGAQERAGAAYARNVGVREARADLILFCDADDEVDPQWLDSMAAALRTADIVGGALEVERLNSPEVRSGYANLHNDLQSGRHALPFATGCSMGIRREVFDQLDGFDESSCPGEDQDLSLRAQLAGFRLAFVPDAVVHYRLRADLRGSARQHFHYGRADAALSRRFPALGTPLTVRGEIWALLHLLLRAPAQRGELSRFPWARDAGLHAGRLVGLVQRPPRERMRVVILSHSAALGGAEIALLRLLRHLPSDFEAHTILFAHGHLEEQIRSTAGEVMVLPLAPDLVTAHRVSIGGSSRAALSAAVRLVPFVIRLARLLRRLAPDVIHTTTLKADLIGVPAAFLAGRPLVWYVHDRIAPDYLPGRMVTLIRFLARHAPRHVLVNSQATAATLPGAGALTVAYPGFTPDQVGTLRADRAVSDSPVVGILGRISPTKGQLVFVRAAARVLRELPDARFRVIGAPLFGEEDYERAVRDAADELGIASRVEFCGFVSDPAAALDDLTVFVHASPTPEPFGQVIVEAMIRGVPTVATSGGGVTEIVRPSGGDPLGWLVPPGDDAALAEAILDALSNPAEAHRRAEAAFHSAQERFAIERTVAAVTDVWSAVARRPRRR